MVCDDGPQAPHLQDAEPIPWEVLRTDVFAHGRNTVRGARENNLKNITLDIPKNRLVVLTGLSGSGKSSLAYDTFQKECVRQYMESMGMVTFLLSKPKVDAIIGLSPSISVDQVRSNRSPRSTVGTSTDVYTYLRILFARLGERDCPECGKRVSPPLETLTGSDEGYVDEAGDDEYFACLHCGGRGTVYDVDLSTLVDEEKSISDGAVMEWNQFMVDFLMSVSLLGRTALSENTPRRIRDPLTCHIVCNIGQQPSQLSAVSNL
jgi:excinuclease ABC subunit A